jgi:hypothetical protein
MIPVSVMLLGGGWMLMDVSSAYACHGYYGKAENKQRKRIEIPTTIAVKPFTRTLCWHRALLYRHNEPGV